MDKNKKSVALIVLIIVMVVVWMPKGRRGPRSSSQETVAFIAEEIIPQKSAPVQKKRSEFTEWGRNPFVWARTGGVSAVSDLTLSGIIWDEQDSYAIIDGAIVHTGDRISGKTVKQIEPNRVILTDGLTDYTLELE